MGIFNTKSRNSDQANSTSLKLQESSALAENSSEIPQVLSIIASILEKTIQKNDRLLKRSRMKDRVTIFHGSRAPTLNIRQYMERIFKYSKCSSSCLIVAYIYMDKFIQATNSYLTSLSVHRLLITCLLVATKFLEDVCFNNAYYAKVGGVSLEEMNRLELKLLFTLDFRLHVTLDTYDQYCLQLEEEATGPGPGPGLGPGPGSCQIELAIEVCGRPNKDEPKCPPKFAAYTCRAI